MLLFAGAGNFLVILTNAPASETAPILFRLTGTAFVTCGIGYMVVRYFGRIYDEPSSTRPLGPIEFDTKALNKLVPRQGKDLLQPPQLSVFLNCVIDPTRHFQRITEHVSPSHTSVRVDTTFSLQVPAPSKLKEGQEDTEYVFPLQLPLRGKLANGLRAYGPDGKRISTLAHGTVVVFELGVMRRISLMISQEYFKNYLDHAEKLVIAAVTNAQLPLAEDIRKANDAILKAAEDGPPLDDAARGLLLQLLDFFSRIHSTHAICVAIPRKDIEERAWPNVLRLRLEHRVTRPPTADVHGVAKTWGKQAYGWATRQWEHFRLACGVRPTRIYFELGNLYQSRSYHVELEGPEGTYFASSGLWGQPDAVKALSSQVTKPGGQRRLHAYFRQRESEGQVRVLSPSSGYKKPDRPPRIFISANFEERSPGSQASPTFAALATVALVTAIAARHASVPNGEPLNDLPLISLLLAVPVAAAAIAGFDANREQRRPQMAARIIPFATGGIAIASVVVAIVQGEGDTVGTFDPDQAWLVLVVTASINFLVSGGSWAGRVAAEYHITRRSGSGKV
ncbi:hypothetical protein MT356_06015 [Rathayibacter festucae]|uniref:hypothetical protein n=1 Tax=Rathayibacter festucae TaxID=110937 RepID=UPI001FB35EBD|nr:hypothetical protein [Rathayibacter festucae]MCJ1699272.1 hypothetical protein [Rathayibacter festucae]